MKENFVIQYELVAGRLALFFLVITKFQQDRDRPISPSPSELSQRTTENHSFKWTLLLKRTTSGISCHFSISCVPCSGNIYGVCKCFWTPDSIKIGLLLLIGNTWTKSSSLCDNFRQTYHENVPSLSYEDMSYETYGVHRSSHVAKYLMPRARHHLIQRHLFRLVWPIHDFWI